MPLLNKYMYGHFTIEKLMAHKNDNETGVVHLRLPSTLTLKELIVVVGVVVSITLAWGMLGSRITVLENGAVDRKELKTELEKLKESHHKLELQVKELEGVVYSLKRK